MNAQTFRRMLAVTISGDLDREELIRELTLLENEAGQAYRQCKMRRENYQIDQWRGALNDIRKAKSLLHRGALQ